MFPVAALVSAVPPGVKGNPVAGRNSKPCLCRLPGVCSLQGFCCACYLLIYFKHVLAAFLPYRNARWLTIQIIIKHIKQLDKVNTLELLVGRRTNQMPSCVFIRLLKLENEGARHTFLERLFHRHGAAIEKACSYVPSRPVSLVGIRGCKSTTPPSHLEFTEFTEVVTKGGI